MQVSEETTINVYLRQVNTTMLHRNCPHWILKKWIVDSNNWLTKKGCMFSLATKWQSSIMDESSFPGSIGQTTPSFILHMHTLKVDISPRHCNTDNATIQHYVHVHIKPDGHHRPTNRNTTTCMYNCTRTHAKLPQRYTHCMLCGTTNNTNLFI
ncbi:hypothetical protein NP493_196g01031 [Ridgeia piscesae]|uniref:Uncharacterized protein n=1 Tax=Ridgeia piscesae TaxID=27915 RepID=A0AAD9P1X6_RIDPI|nr:hypothetical protein NP493_196g01031 [Ridgeia piscesae]